MGWGSLIGPIAGAVGGVIGAGQGGQAPSQTVQGTTTQGMSPGMQGQWNAFQNFANQAAAMPFQANPNQGVADFTQDQYGAMDQTRDRAHGGPSGMYQAGGAALQQQLAGPQAGGNNPFLDGIISRNQNDLQARMGASAFGSGSFGNAGVAEAGARGMADASNSMRYQDYNDAMGRQQAGIGMALNYDQQGYSQGRQNTADLMQSGSLQQNQGQNYLNDATARWNEMRNYPRQQMAYLGAPLGMGQGSVGSSSSTTPGAQGNPMASAIGGGLLGYQFGNNMVNGPRQNQSPAPIINNYGYDQSEGE